MDHEKYNNTMSFVDMLFLIVLGFAFLFIISFLLIKPPSKPNIQQKAEFQIVLNWADGSKHDVDIWILKPNGQKIYFNRQKDGLMHLDRDDTGTVNDYVRSSEGDMIKNETNREVVSLRGKVPGDYVVNVHLYRHRGKEKLPIKVKVELIRVNPYRIEISKSDFLFGEGDEITMFRFTLDKDGKVVKFDRVFQHFIIPEMAR